MSSPLVNCLLARHEILSCNLRIGVSADVFAKISADCRQALIALLGRHTVTETDAARALSMVADGPMLATDKV